MRILIDLTQIPVNKVGVGIYGLNLARELLRLDGESEYIFLAQDDDPDLPSLFHARAKLVRVPARLFRLLPLRLLLEQFYIPWLAWKCKIDVIHSLHYSFPLAALGAYRVVTVHDMTLFSMPELHPRFKGTYGRFFMRMAALWANKLLFVSDSSRNDYLTKFPAAAEKSVTVHLGCGEEFNALVNSDDEVRVLAKYGIRKPYILFLGTLEPRKNVPALVEAFARIKPEFPELQLVLTGKKGWHYHEIFQTVEKLGLQSCVHFTGFVEEKEKPVLLRGAAMFVYASLYEGFGIPVLEAIACGTPTITSNISSMPEVAGDAALFVTPGNITELAEAMRRLLTDRSLVDDLRRKGRTRAAQFRWDQMAATTLAVYKNRRPR